MPTLRMPSFRLLIVIFAATALACDDGLTSPENLGELAVTLEITGTPGPGGFVAEWSDLDSHRSGRAPLNPDFLPKTFSQVPLGATRVALVDIPVNCFADRTRKTADVVRNDTRQIGFEITCEDGPLSHAGA